MIKGANHVFNRIIIIHGEAFRERERDGLARNHHEFFGNNSVEKGDRQYLV